MPMIERVEAAHDLSLLSNPAPNSDLDEAYRSGRQPSARSQARVRAIEVAVDLDSPEGPRAWFIDRDAGREVLVSAENRVYLVYFLAEAVRKDRQSGVRNADLGWRTNQRTAVAVWGRDGLYDPRRLKSLVFNTRAELRAAGLDPWCLDKRRGGIRLDVGRVRL